MRVALPHHSLSTLEFLHLIVLIKMPSLGRLNLHQLLPETRTRSTNKFIAGWKKGLFIRIPSSIVRRKDVTVSEHVNRFHLEPSEYLVSMETMKLTMSILRLNQQQEIVKLVQMILFRPRWWTRTKRNASFRSRLNCEVAAQREREQPNSRETFQKQRFWKEESV